MLEKEQIGKILNRLKAVEEAMGDADILADPKRYRETVREHTSLRKLESVAKAYFKLLDDIDGNKALVEDPDFGEMAKDEIASLEAALFAGDLLRMYLRYCETRGWKVNIMSANATSLDGYKEVIFTIVGEGAYGLFRFESGGHRVQRVPETEAQGRVHTSAATVVVFPEADEEDELEIPEKDIRIDLFFAGGAGGQHVNKTESAVRRTHLPTGLVAQCQDERSQQRNREKCLATLKARILDHRRREAEAKAGADRLSLRGSGDRSERIRTYNFPQNRLTDHRIDLTLYSLDHIMEGEISPVLDALLERDVDQRIKNALNKELS